MRDLVELLCGGQVAPERLFDNNARVLGQFRGAETFDHGFKERGWNCQIVRRPPRLTQHFFDRRERAGVFIVSTHILEQGEKMLQCAFIIDSARSLYAVRHALVQTHHAPLWKGDTDDRNFESAFFHHCIECREDHLVGQIACHTEDHWCVRMGLGHQAPALLSAAFSSWPPN